MFQSSQPCLQYVKHREAGVFMIQSTVSSPKVANKFEKYWKVINNDPFIVLIKYNLYKGNPALDNRLVSHACYVSQL